MHNTLLSHPAGDTAAAAASMATKSADSASSVLIVEAAAAVTRGGGVGVGGSAAEGAGQEEEEEEARDYPLSDSLHLDSFQGNKHVHTSLSRSPHISRSLQNITNSTS